MKYYVVDAFTDEIFKGNQAGVCLLEEFISDAVMQNIAMENNLSETAFAVKRESYYDLRWFTPNTEIDLCGHATLATAFIIFNHTDYDKKTVRFMTKSGELTVEMKDSLLEMDFPSRDPIATQITTQMEEALGVRILEAYESRDLLLRIESEDMLKNLVPNMTLLAELSDWFGVIVTAKGNEVDFVSRYFAPRAGINEDPVSGSPHCNLIPFWSKRLNKNTMIAKRLSFRTGTLYCENAGERVKIAGKAVLYLKGEILVD